MVLGLATGLLALAVAGAAAAVAATAWAVAVRRGGDELGRVLPGDGPASERLAAFRASVRRDRELAAAERELGAVRVQAADIRTRLAASTQLESELGGLRDRVTAALRDRGIDPADLGEGLRRYDLGEATARERSQATATCSRASEELRRLLGDDSLTAAQERLAQLEARLNGHAELARGCDPDEVEQELAGARRALADASATGERLGAAVAERLRTLPDTAALRERADELDERVARLHHIDSVLRLAESELAAAAADTYRDFAPQLNASLEAGIGRLTGGRYAHAFVDETLGIRLEAPETGTVVDLDRLSVGTQKQAYLVQRLELVRLLCPASQPLPVLLDDPFAHFDADRLERTLGWLDEAACERQIVVFATQRRVVDLAPAGAAVIAL
jgi:DNA repair exonuclease SbcCD ATPase subunit